MCSLGKDTILKETRNINRDEKLKLYPKTI